MHGEPILAHVAIAGEIIDELNDIEASFLDDITKSRRLNALEAKAFAVKEQDEAVGLSLLGSLAAAKGNKAKVHEFHVRSLQHGDDPLLALNYVVSLTVVKEFEKAIRLAESFIADNPSDPRGPKVLADAYFEKWDTEMFWRYANMYEKLTGTKHKLCSEVEMYADMEKDTDESLAKLCAAGFSASLNKEELETWTI